jgi:hypothetical protein
MKMTDAQVQLIKTYNKVVGEGKVLDVSGLTEKGTGSRGHAALKGDKGTKKAVAAFPSVISDNYAAYALAMNMFGPANVPNGAQLAAEFNRMYGGAKILRAAAAVKAVKSPRSPKSPKVPKSPRRVYSGPTAQVQMPGGEYITVRTPRRSPQVQARAGTSLIGAGIYIPPRSPSPLRGSSPRLITPPRRVSSPRRPSPRSSAGRAPSPQATTVFPRRPQAPILPSGTRLSSSSAMSSPLSVPTLQRSSSPNRMIVPTVRGSQ